MTNFPGGISNSSIPVALSFTRHGNLVSVMRFSRSASVTTLGSGCCSSTSAHIDTVLGAVESKVVLGTIKTSAVGGACAVGII